LGTLLSVVSAPASARATIYYASPDGTGDGTSEDSPASVSTALNAAEPGDTVYLRGGTYSSWSQGIHPVRSGTADAWITFEAYPGELPFFEGTGVGSGTYEYIRYVGLISRGSSGGFGNGWTDGDCNTMSNGNLEYINCIADGNDINGIAHYCASGVHIKQSIVAHNGAQDPSWSSGVNLFAVKGDSASNVVEQTVSFENVDISTHHSDGSGFITDQNSTGATFINNIGFRNGGSCIRITNSTNVHMINNTCVTNGQDPDALYHDEIFFSDTSTTHQGALLRNNLCIPTSGQSGLTMGNGVEADSNVFDGASSLVLSTVDDLDYHLQADASSVIDQGSPTDAPTEDIGFDWRCIKQQSGQAVSWWQYAVDYDYIATIGGVAACFAPGVRQGTPDIGAYEFGAVTGTGGSAGTGGAGDTGGTTTTGGTVDTGGATPTGGGAATGGMVVTGGVTTTGGVAVTGGVMTTGGTTTIGGSGPATGGTSGTAGTGGGGPAGGAPTSGGTSATGGNPGTGVPTPSEEEASGCACSTVGTGSSTHLGSLLGALLGLVALRRRRTRQGGWHA